MSRALDRLPNQITMLLSSIRFRLALWFVLILGVVILLFSAFVYTRQARDLRAAAVDRLELKAQRLTGSQRVISKDFFERSFLRIPIDPISGESYLQDGDVLAVVNLDGKVVRSWGLEDASRISLFVEEGLRVKDLSLPVTARLFSARIQSEDQPRPVRYLMVVVPVLDPSLLTGYLLIGNPVDPNGQLPRLLFSLSIGTLLTLGMAMLGGFWLAHRAIYPVKKITATARSISETDLSQRLNIDRKDELGELAGTFDEMLARLQAAFERQRQFTADASHELRTPLTIVDLETSRALSTRRSPQEYEQILKVIKSENHFMVQLVNNLLTLARMDAGQIRMQRESQDLSDIALEVVERLVPIAAKAQVTISTGELPELCVMGDRQYLAQMMTNLVENAIKYSGPDDRRVEVETGMRRAGAEPQAWVQVIDHGPGISPEHLPFLFDRFYQVEKARTQHNHADETGSHHLTSGAGLGLSITQWIARAHGGDIQVHSEIGRGSIFEVTLPLLEDAGS